MRLPLEARSQRRRALSEVGDRNALVQVITQPRAVAARRRKADFEEQVQRAGKRVHPMAETRRRAQSGSLQQAAERFRPGAACIRVIQGHECCGHPESLVLLHLPAQPGLRWRWFDPAANKVVIFPRAVNAGQVVPQVPVLLAGAKNGSEVSLQLIGCERQVHGMHEGGHKPTVDAVNRRRQQALLCRLWAAGANTWSGRLGGRPSRWCGTRRRGRAARRHLALDVDDSRHSVRHDA